MKTRFAIHPGIPSIPFFEALKTGVLFSDKVWGLHWLKRLRVKSSQLIPDLVSTANQPVKRFYLVLSVRRKTDHSASLNVNPGILTKSTGHSQRENDKLFRVSVTRNGKTVHNQYHSFEVARQAWREEFYDFTESGDSGPFRVALNQTVDPPFTKCLFNFSER